MQIRPESFLLDIYRVLEALCEEIYRMKPTSYVFGYDEERMDCKNKILMALHYITQTVQKIPATEFTKNGMRINQ